MTDEPMLVLGRKGLADFMGLSQSYIAKMVDEGYIKKLSHGKYDVSDCVKGYVKYRSDGDRSKFKSKGASNLSKARADKIEFELKVMKREYIPMTETLAAIDELCGSVRSEFAGLPARFTRDLSVRKSIDDEVSASLNRISDKYSKIAEKLDGIESE